MTVFLTGFPGFLASALLERLLERGEGPVVCLVEARFRESARERLREMGACDAVTLRVGDITEPNLGLADGDSPSVEEVYHLAAVYDLGVERDVAEAVNVEGTKNVLEFTARAGADRLHYVSTCYVSGRYDGVFTASNLREGQSFNNHYERSKYRAELAVRERMGEEFDVTIYRPAIVAGDSQTGETDKFDGPYYLLRTLLAQPSWLSLWFRLPGSRRAELNVVPRDYVVDAMAALSAMETTRNGTYQLCDPAPPTIPALTALFAGAIDHRVVEVPAPKSVARQLTRGLQRTGFPVEAAAIDYMDHPARYAQPNTRRALAGSGIEPPPLESYVDTLVEFVRESERQ